MPTPSPWPPTAATSDWPPLGTTLTQEQAVQLAHLHSPVVVATDADLAGHLAAERDHWLLAQHNVTTFAAAIPEGNDPADLLHSHGTDAVTNALLSSTPLSDVLLQERLTNLPADKALEPAVQVLATADPAGWDRTSQQIADRLGVEEPTVRRELDRAVRAWHEHPRTVVTHQLDQARDVRARVETARKQPPETRWAATADRLDHRLTAQQDWPALAQIMAHLHETEHDVETIARASIDAAPLLTARPAQDLRYRLAVNAPPVQLAPHVHTGSTAARRDDNHHIVAHAHDRSGGIPR